jgi:hypothetical protein
LRARLRVRQDLEGKIEGVRQELIATRKDLEARIDVISSRMWWIIGLIISMWVTIIGAIIGSIVFR